MRHFYLLAALSLSALAVSCSGSPSAISPTGPTTASPTGSASQVAAAQGTSLGLRGFVMDTAYRPLSGARIEVVDGPSAGVAAIADADGQFVLQGSFDAATQFRAIKDGHETKMQPWNCSVAVCLGASNAQPWLGFYLTVLEPTVNIAGDYTLTITAASTCTDLPDIARTRSYRVAVTAQSTAGRSTIPGFDVKAGGARFIGSLGGFPIGAAGARLSLWLHGRHDPAIVEDLGGNAYLGFSGTADATVIDSGASTISARFDGWIEHVVLSSPLGQWYYPQGAAISKATCDSSGHRITLTRETN